MAGTGVGKFSSTAGNNTSNMTTNFAENMAPSNVNNAARELMAHIYDMYKQLGDGYFEYGDGDATYTVARSDADTITITSASDISSIYFPGRKIRITDGGANVVEGTIASSSHSSTTQTVNLTGISLASGTPTKVELGIDTAAFGGRIILDDDGDSYIEAPTDDTIDFYAGGTKIGTFTATTVDFNDGVTITTADNSDTLSLISTDGDALVGPVLRLFRNSSSPADDDVIGNLVFSGQDGAGNETDFLTFQVNASDVANGAEDGFMRIMMPVASTSTEFFRMNPAGFVFNEGSADLDFRVESNGNTHMFFVDAGNDRIGIGSSSPDREIDIESSSTVGLRATNTSGSQFDLQVAGNTSMGTLDSTSLLLTTNNAERVRIASDGKVGIGTSSPLNQLHVRSSGNGIVRFDGNANTNTSTLLVSHNTSGDCGLQFNSNQLNMFSYGDIAFFPSTSNISGSYPNGQTVVFKNSGKVGIGTSSLTATLTVKAPNNTTTQQLVLTDNDDQTKTHIGNFSNQTYITNNTHYNGSAWVRDDNGVGTSFIGAGDGTINFGTSTGATPTNRWVIDSTGNLVPQSTSLGIYLGVSSATASNLLHDYEEGTWTPTLAGTWASNPTSMSGKYTKIGQIVTLSMIWQNGSKSSSTAAHFTSLPFAPLANSTAPVSDTGVDNNGIVLCDTGGRIFTTTNSFGSDNNYLTVTYISNT